jgi:putative hydrolase of the HAD superfamily
MNDQKACSNSAVNGEPIEAVVFDFGGVITSSPFNAIKRWGIEQGHDPELVLRLLLGPAVDGDHPFHRAERGEIPAMEMFTVLSEEAKIKHGIDLGGMLATGPMTVREDVVAYIQDLKTENYRVALISNNLKELSGRWRELVAIDDLFDLVVESSSEGVRKPVPAIYELTLQRLGVAAHRSIFLDDLQENVDGAIAAGMRGVFVTDEYHHALDEVDRLLGRTRTNSHMNVD